METTFLLLVPSHHPSYLVIKVRNSIRSCFLFLNLWRWKVCPLTFTRWLFLLLCLLQLLAFIMAPFPSLWTPQRWARSRWDGVWAHCFVFTRSFPMYRLLLLFALLSRFSGRQDRSWLPFYRRKRTRISRGCDQVLTNRVSMCVFGMPTRSARL